MSKKPDITHATLVKSNRQRQMSFGFGAHKELSVELFAGAGGFSAGARLAGLTMDIGINHNPVALAIHQVNFPDSTQFINDIFEYNPKDVLVSQGIDPEIFDELKQWREHRKSGKSLHAVYHLHGSPDCTWHSGAKGGPLERHTVCGDHCSVDHTELDQSVSERIRGLGWVLIGWAMVARPRRISLENVPEYEDWSPTYTNEKGEVFADKSRKGETFRAFIGVLSTGIDQMVTKPLPHILFFVDPADVPARKRKTINKNNWFKMKKWIDRDLHLIQSTSLSLEPWHGWKMEHPTLPEIRRFLQPYLGELYDEQALIAGLGYDVSYKKDIVHSEYGSPTSRKRLYLIARSDGVPIEWPEKTHGDPKSDEVKSGQLLPWRTAGECINWSIVAPSIFDSKEEIKKSLGISVRRPLVENTLRRIARGTKKYVIETDQPYIVKVNHSCEVFRGQELDRPLQTITSKHGYGLAVPYMQSYYGPTSTSNEFRGSSLHNPVNTITAGGQRHGLVVPYITGIDNQSSGPYSVWGADRPLTTIVKENRHALTAAYVMNAKGTDASRMPIGNSPFQPLTTITKNDSHSMIFAHMKRGFGESIGAPMNAPSPTIMSNGGDKISLVATHCIKMKGDNLGYGTDEPVQTITAGGLSHGLVASHLYKFYGEDRHGQSIDEPIHTIRTKDCFGLITESLGYPPMTEEQRYKAWQIARLLEVYADEPIPMLGGVPLPRKPFVQTRDGSIIYDMGMRMLTERELFSAQGFSKDFIFDPEILVRDKNGKITKRRVNKTEAVAAVGNSVPPHFITALVTALNESEIKHFGCLANEIDYSRREVS
jgi:site-specific DNA-cytosine methylase